MSGVPICERLQGFIDYIRTGKEAGLDAAVRRDDVSKGYLVPDEFDAMIDAAISRQAETLEVRPGISELYANPAASQAMLADADFDVLAWLAEAIASDMRFASTGPTRILRDPYTHKPYVHFYATRPANMLSMTSNRSVSEMVLKPCPFCGGEAAHMGGHVRCKNNACPVDVSALTADFWNTRASSQAQSDDVVEWCAEWLTTNVTRIGSDNVQGIAAAMVAEVSAAIPPAGGVEERLREALHRLQDARTTLVKMAVAKIGRKVSVTVPASAFQSVVRNIDAARATLNESSAIGGGDGR